MTDDLVKRLRECGPYMLAGLTKEAADRIEELELERDVIAVRAMALFHHVPDDTTAGEVQAAYDALLARFKDIRREALEEAARACEDMQMGWAADDHLECAAAIRALMEKE